VTAWNVDDWQNYTRTFPNAEYRVYLRYGALSINRSAWTW